MIYSMGLGPGLTHGVILKLTNVVFFSAQSKPRFATVTGLTMRINQCLSSDLFFHQTLL